jgi:hypothetical protein
MYNITKTLLVINRSITVNKKLGKTIIGILLIICAITGVIYWELIGREQLLMDKVLVAKEDILEGDLLESNMLQEVSIPKSLLIIESLNSKDSDRLIGKVSRHYVPKNAQLSSEYFQEDNLWLEHNESIYVINPEWIEMISSAVRAGDIVNIYSKDGQVLLGEFMVAFVKDSTFREVKSVQEIKKDTGILNRYDATSVVSYIEIKTTLKEYGDINEYLNLSQENKLLIVIKV